jgi:uncharacterized protein
MLPAGVGLGWRPETAWLIDRRGVAFSEVIAEAVDPRRPPRALAAAIDRGLPVICHGVTLDLGGTRLDRERVRRFARVVRALRAPLASEHVAFRRAGELEAPHFLPVPHDRAQLAILVDHVRWVQDALPVPLALENVAAPVVWPGAELAEADFLAELLVRTGARLLLDVANLYANLTNHGGDLEAYLARLPLDQIAYLHVAGGARSATGSWRDTHAHPMGPAVLETLATVLARSGPVPILLERDRGFHTRGELEGELAVLEAALARTSPRLPVMAGASHLASLEGISLPAARHELAARHHALIAAAIGAAEPPAGFAPHHVAELRMLVADKRSRCRPDQQA